MPNAAKIRELNDVFRLDPRAWGRLMVTNGVNALGPCFVLKAVQAVRTFSAFDNGNDPYHEHDFAKLTVLGEDLFFKIDYYEKGTNFTAGAEDPANRDTTDRVLTIMLVSEY